MRVTRWLLVLVLLFSAAFAQEADEVKERRVITIDGSGGTQSGNLRTGPLIYDHPDEFGITATVSNLTILSQVAELHSPSGASISVAGERVAIFPNTVRVERGRMEAIGTSLRYDEGVGVGELAGRAEITVAPNTDDGDITVISADTVEFDVDTDRSTSGGAVELTSGNQYAQAELLDYEEERGLGVLYGPERVRIERTAKDGGVLVITAEEIRVLTDTKQLYAIGAVHVLDGDVESWGAVVLFDDETGIAEVIGTDTEPAHAKDTVSGSELRTDRILQYVELNFFEAIDSSVPSSFDTSLFQTSAELAED